MEQLLVSVIMATFNDKEEYLSMAIDSILKQTYKNFEFIIVDDSNQEQCSRYLQNRANQDMRIRLIHNQEKLGFVQSLNLGIRMSNGSYIARMDSDDVALPERLEKEKLYLDIHLEVGIVGSAIYVIDENGEITGARNYCSGHDAIKRGAFFRNPMAHPTTMYRRCVVEKIGLYDEQFLMAEDYEFWLRGLKYGVVFHNLEEKLLKYRIGKDYYRKRSMKNWQYNIMAKYKNWQFGLRPLCGILFSMIMYLLPQLVIGFLYELDRKKQNSY